MIDKNFYSLREPISLGDLAKDVDVELRVDGAEDEIIAWPSALDDSLPESITFFSDKRRKSQLEEAKATACLTTEKLAPFVEKAGMIALVTDNPRAVFSRLSGEMVQLGRSTKAKTDIHKTAHIHPSAVVGENVTIGAGTQIGANSVIEDNVIIGENCIIEPLVRVSFTVMGDECHIKSGSIVGGTGFGVVKDDKGIFSIPHLGRVIIHNRVHIGSNCCIDRGQLGDTEIGDDVKIDNLVQIAHNVTVGEGTMIAGHSGISGSCSIGKQCLLGRRASLADHVNVADGAIIAAFAGVMADVPSGEMYSGAPAMPVREHMRTVATLKKLAKRS